MKFNAILSLSNFISLGGVFHVDGDGIWERIGRSQHVGFKLLLFFNGKLKSAMDDGRIDWLYGKRMNSDQTISSADGRGDPRGTKSLKWIGESEIGFVVSMDMWVLLASPLGWW